MCPILLKFGPIQIYSYGFMVAAAFLTCGYLLSRRVHSLGVDKDFLWNWLFWILLGGIAGGRLLYILLNLQFFLSSPGEIFMVWHGGLVWYGALLGGFLSGVLYIRLKRIPVLAALDLVVPYIALGHAIGRIGCLLNGCCYGKAAIWGLYFRVHDAYLIPTQLFSSLTLLFIFIFLRFLQDRINKKGMIFVCYLLLSSINRFFMEFLRNDSAPFYFGLTIYQVISLGIFITAGLLWIIILSSQKRMKASA